MVGQQTPGHKQLRGRELWWTCLHMLAVNISSWTVARFASSLSFTQGRGSSHGPEVLFLDLIMPC